MQLPGVISFIHSRVSWVSRPRKPTSDVVSSFFGSDLGSDATVCAGRFLCLVILFLLFRFFVLDCASSSFPCSLPAASSSSSLLPEGEVFLRFLLVCSECPESLDSSSLGSCLVFDLGFLPLPPGAFLVFFLVGVSFRGLLPLLPGAFWVFFLGGVSFWGKVCFVVVLRSLRRGEGLASAAFVSDPSEGASCEVRQVQSV